MYKVIKFFTDLQDDNFAYKEGDIFPRAGKEVTQERLDELSSPNNLQNTPLIVAVNKKPAGSKKTSKTGDKQPTGANKGSKKKGE